MFLSPSGVGGPENTLARMHAWKSASGSRGSASVATSALVGLNGSSKTWLRPAGTTCVDVLDGSICLPFIPFAVGRYSELAMAALNAHTQYCAKTVVT